MLSPLAGEGTHALLEREAGCACRNRQHRRDSSAKEIEAGCAWSERVVPKRERERAKKRESIGIRERFLEEKRVKMLALPILKPY